MSTDVPEIQDVHWPKSMATPPTAQTAGPNWLKFFMEALQEDSFRGTGRLDIRMKRDDALWAGRSVGRSPGLLKGSFIFGL